VFYFYSQVFAKNHRHVPREFAPSISRDTTTIRVNWTARYIRSGRVIWSVARVLGACRTASPPVSMGAVGIMTIMWTRNINKFVNKCTHEWMNEFDSVRVDQIKQQTNCVEMLNLSWMSIIRPVDPWRNCYFFVALSKRVRSLWLWPVGCWSYLVQHWDVAYASIISCCPTKNEAYGLVTKLRWPYTFIRNWKNDVCNRQKYF